MIRTLLFLCLVHYAPAWINTGFGVKWKSFDDVLVSKSFMFEITNVYKSTRCVLLCLQNESCVSVFYRRQHRRCQFHDVLFMSPEDGEQENGTMYYSLTTGDCVPGYIHNRLLNICYQLHLDKISYDDALADCTSRGEHFAVIDNADKQNHVVKQIKSSSAARTFSYFLDGSDAANEGQWVFHDGRPMTYFAWRSGNPTGSAGEKDYIVASKLDNAFLWRDGRQTEEKNYICQKDL
ncbi:alpha-N-acetylgalactosamine-specific lectin-like [Haliotis asinina]|uniref:alpha-N-acetylgalactosamine-specific lectin-like n=1 Tax=Haliotis asinina TaxID=109174 RepID=UPI003531DD5C